jgi:peptidoglycan/xylan/chitin deacetylase (PgdA/CDA1 family)
VTPGRLGLLFAPVNAGRAANAGVTRRLPALRGVALTFDDGPHPEGTPRMLEILGREEVRATFFLVGEQVRRYPAVVSEIVAAGHAVALHGDRHRVQARLTARAVAEDIARGLATVAEAAGVQPVLHRPPLGIYSPAGLAAARAHGLTPLLWSRWGKDWRRLTTPARIAARATRSIGAGDVVLLHDADHYSSRNSHRRTAAALPLVLEALRERGLATVAPDSDSVGDHPR